MFLQTQEGSIYFTELAERVEYGNCVHLEIVQDRPEEHGLHLLTNAGCYAILMAMRFQNMQSTVHICDTTDFAVVQDRPEEHGLPPGVFAGSGGK